MNAQPSLVDVTPTLRRADDFYVTPGWMTRALLRRVVVGGTVYEPCCGDGAIIRELARERVEIVSNDLVARPPEVPDFLLDARDPATWTAFRAHQPIDWVVTNPPFNIAFPIVRQAVEHARTGVATLLRLSWLEPTDERGPWLAAHPPDGLIVLPRHDFRGNGKTDSVTSAWMIWTANKVHLGVDVVTKAERDAEEGT